MQSAGRFAWSPFCFVTKLSSAGHRIFTLRLYTEGKADGEGNRSPWVETRIYQLCPSPIEVNIFMLKKVEQSRRKDIMMEILRVEHLNKIYGSGDTAVHVLDDVSFTVEKGEFVAIVGPSGSGKSTLMHILGGVDSPTSGKVFVDGTEIGTLDETELAIFRRRQIGLIYQFYNLIPVLNIKENITLPLLLDGREVDEKSLSDLVSSLGLTDRLGYLPNQLSGGQQQRVSIGRALITHPALILADEPTGNLDRQNSAEIIELLKMFNRQHSQTLLVITHDENIALQADRILVVEDGRIMRDETLRSCPGGEGKAQ